jgi:hypothetical protein
MKKSTPNSPKTYIKAILLGVLVPSSSSNMKFVIFFVNWLGKVHIVSEKENDLAEKTSILNVLSTVDIYNEDSHVDLRKIMKIIGATDEELASLLELKVPTVKANHGSIKTDKKAQPLVYALELLAPLCNGDTKKMCAWFIGPKVYWGGLSPLDMFLAKKGAAVTDALRAMSEGEAGVGS